MEPSTREPDPDWVRDADAWIASDAEIKSDAMTIIPTRVESGVAVFSDKFITSVKDLNSIGIPARYLTSSGERQFHSEYSQLANFVGSFLFSVSSNASWDVLKYSFQYLRSRLGHGQRSGNVTLRVGAVRLPDGTRTAWAEVTGLGPGTFDKAEGIVRAQIESLMNGGDSSD